MSKPGKEEQKYPEQKSPTSTDRQWDEILRRQRRNQRIYDATGQSSSSFVPEQKLQEHPYGPAQPLVPFPPAVHRRGAGPAGRGGCPAGGRGDGVAMSMGMGMAMGLAMRMGMAMTMAMLMWPWPWP